MAAYFFDSSALVKSYIAEIGTDWTRSIVNSEENVVHVASLTRVEVISALTRRFKRGDIPQTEFDRACLDSKLDMANQFEVIRITDPMIEEAATLAQKRGLRAYDAVQLATALDTSRVTSQVELTQVILVSADLELNVAAAAEGLKVEDPNTH
jgi:predicted nucleic acid-binding protein